VYVSCRTINWRRGAFPSSFRVYECVGFSAPQRERFVTRWFQENTEECSLFQRRFLSQPRLYALFRSPLLLSLTLVASEHTDFGSDVIFRSSLYQQFIELLLSRRTRRSTQSEESNPGTRLDVLEAVATQMQHVGRDVLPLAEMLTIISSRIGNLGLQISAVAMLAELVEVDGILERQGPSRFRFLHRTFQEYLAAQSLAKDDRALEKLTSVWSEPRWEETIRLFCEVGNDRQVDEFLTFLASEESNDTRRLVLLARCLSDAPGTKDELIRWAIERLLKIAFESVVEHASQECLISAALLLGKAPWLVMEYREAFANIIGRGGAGAAAVLYVLQLAGTEDAAELLELCVRLEVSLQSLTMRRK
jgi:hypothetical protein